MCDSKRNIDMLNYVGMRKHSSQMTEKEKSALMHRIISIDNWRMTKHANQRGRKKNRGKLVGFTINERTARRIIKSSTIVKYGIGLKDCTPYEEVMIRSRWKINNKNILLVLSLTSKTINTVIIVDENNRRRVDERLYNEKMKVFN